MLSHLDGSEDDLLRDAVQRATSGMPCSRNGPIADRSGVKFSAQFESAVWRESDVVGMDDDEFEELEIEGRFLPTEDDEEEAQVRAGQIAARLSELGFGRMRS